MNSLCLTLVLASVALSAASPALNSSLEDCTITRFDQAASVCSQCKNIQVGSFAVPAGQTLKLALQSGSTLTFAGELSFAFAQWDGPLVWITGNSITVQGTGNHLINGRGELWWDGKGDHSNRKKPQTMLIQSTGGSVFKNINVRNCPHTCIGISDSHDVTLDHWNINCADGDTKGGANTDGFDIAKSYKITLKNSVVHNQDDCVCINQGQDLTIDNMQCTGSHGLSIAVGIWNTYALNTVNNVTFSNSVVQASRLGIHVKTIAGSQTGEISDVTYKNIKLSGIAYYGINVQQDYTNDGDTGHPMGNIKIKRLRIENVYGTLHGPHSQDVYVLCGSGGCSDWSWSGINLQGASNKNYCNFNPGGFNCK
ncbi:unnamed protein product [Phyllotreta striolata]|uniref:endo-polygalacturonase n=1 Tax=Phyllotreta striolata TaxID=444603 RepID=A0A9N9XIY0_PHYSR|nr:unnamed protein product [Phyllotreta striolata]